jgi:hypothetical protein
MIGRTLEWRLKRRDESIVNDRKLRSPGNALLSTENAATLAISSAALPTGNRIGWRGDNHAIEGAPDECFAHPSVAG